MSRGDHLGEFEALVLACVLRASNGITGTALYDAIFERTGRTPSVPAIHVTLRRLGAKGLVSSVSGEVGPRGGKPARHYRVTPSGCRRLRAFRVQWDAVWDGIEWTEMPE